MDNANKAASPTKLRTGSWGATVKSATVTEGEVITITTRSGKSWDAIVDAIVWSGNGVTIVSTAKAATVTPAPQRRERYGRGHGAAATGISGYSAYCTDNASCRCYDCAS